MPGAPADHQPDGDHDGQTDHGVEQVGQALGQDDGCSVDRQGAEPVVDPAGGVGGGGQGGGLQAEQHSHGEHAGHEEVDVPGARGQLQGAAEQAQEQQGHEHGNSQVMITAGS